MWDVTQYPHFISSLKRHAFAHHRLEIINKKVDAYLLAPLGVSAHSSGDLVTMLERLGIYESNSNVYVLRANFTGDDSLLAKFPSEIKCVFLLLLFLCHVYLYSCL